MQRIRLLLTTVTSLFALWPTASPGQRVVRESYAQWQAARALKLLVTQRWCVEVDAPGCDMRDMWNAVSLPDSGVLLADVIGPMRRFSGAGQFMNELGRRGKGPGEYGYLVDAQIVSAGYLTWFDNSQMRIASIHLDGNPGPVKRLLPPPTMQMPYAVGEELVILDVPSSTTVGDTVVGTYRTVPANGEPRVLGRVRTPSLFQPGSNTRPEGAPFTPRIVASVGWSGDIAHSNGAQYIIEMMPSVGPSWRLEVAFPNRAVTAAERDSVLAQLFKRYDVSRLADLPLAQRERLDRSNRTVPPLQAIRVLRDGTVWIRPAPSSGESTARWDVFSRDGYRIGYARLPLSASVKDGMREWILVVERGRDDVPLAVRYAVSR